MSVALQLDIFNASQSSAKFLSQLLAILSKHNVHLQALFAFEALGTLLTAPSILTDQTILILGGDQDVRTAELYSLFGWRRQDLPAYLRKSSGCVKSFLLLAALKGVLYDEDAISEVMLQILCASGLNERFPCAAKQIERLLHVLEPQTRPFLEDVACAKVRLLCLANALSGDVQGDLVSAGAQLAPRTLGTLLNHAFEAVRKHTGLKTQPGRETGTNTVELRGSRGLFDIAAVLLWLAPDAMSLSLHRSEAHPCYRTLDLGCPDAPLLIQIGRDSFESDDKGNPTGGWQRVPWYSAQAVAQDMLGWLSVAQPLVRGMPGVMSGVALGLAKRWVG